MLRVIFSRQGVLRQVPMAWIFDHHLAWERASAV
jgi:hypothetical protein